MIGAAKARFVAHPPAPLAKGSTPPARLVSSPERSPRRGTLLSLLLPGLGQLDQCRIRSGLSLMAVALGILGIGGVSWMTALGRFADQPQLTPAALAIAYAALCIFGIWDAVRYAREAA